MNDHLTPLQALVALVAVAETSLDYRPQFRRALADAHTTIMNPRPAAAALMQSVEIGGSLETDESFALSLGEVMRRVAPPEISAIFRNMELEA